MQGVVFIKSGLLKVWTKYYAELVCPLSTQRPQLILRKKQFDGKVESRFQLDDPSLKVYPYASNDTDIIIIVAE